MIISTYFLNLIRFGDKIDFNIGEQRRPGGPVRMAVNVRLVLRNLTGRCQGFIATLKDNYGFIENVDHDKEVFFHFRFVFITWLISMFFL